MSVEWACNRRGQRGYTDDVYPDTWLVVYLVVVYGQCSVAVLES